MRKIYLKLAGKCHIHGGQLLCEVNCEIRRNRIKYKKIYRRKARRKNWNQGSLAEW